MMTVSRGDARLTGAGRAEGKRRRLRSSQLVLESLVELDPLLPGEGLGVVGVVGGDEGADRPRRRREVGQLGPLEALLAEDGEPGLDEGEPGSMQRQPVE